MPAGASCIQHAVSGRGRFEEWSYPLRLLRQGAWLQSIFRMQTLPNVFPATTRRSFVTARHRMGASS
jgi:hypothetical protein